MNDRALEGHRVKRGVTVGCWGRRWGQAFPQTPKRMRMVLSGAFISTSTVTWKHHILPKFSQAYVHLGLRTLRQENQSPETDGVHLPWQALSALMLTPTFPGWWLRMGYGGPPLQDQHSEGWNTRIINPVQTGLRRNPDLNKQASKNQKQTTATSNLQQQSQARGQVGKMYSLEIFWIFGFWIINWFVLCWGSRWGLGSYDLTYPRWVLDHWVTLPVLIWFFVGQLRHE